jgi:hypothetical protein
MSRIRPSTAIDTRIKTVRTERLPLSTPRTKLSRPR